RERRHDHDREAESREGHEYRHGEPGAGPYRDLASLDGREDGREEDTDEPPVARVVEDDAYAGLEERREDSRHDSDVGYQALFSTTAFREARTIDLVLTDVVVGVRLELVAGGTSRRLLGQLEQRRVDDNCAEGRAVAVQTGKCCVRIGWRIYCFFAARISGSLRARLFPPRGAGLRADRNDPRDRCGLPARPPTRTNRGVRPNFPMPSHQSPATSAPERNEEGAGRDAPLLITATPAPWPGGRTPAPRGTPP
ncbi:hypothetical protein THAOC_10829, partial [Thalassiosira oceanica]